MNEAPDTDHEDAKGRNPSMTDGPEALRDWFLREVLPLEAVLTQYLRHNWQDRATVADLLQEIYVRVYEAACHRRPDSTKSFVFAIAHNLLVDRVRREKVIPIETVDNLEALGVAAETPSPEAQTSARDELRRVQAALDHLPPRARQAFVLFHVEGLTPGEIATRMGISEKTVSWHLNEGVNGLANILYGATLSKRGKP
jgi:RNA polymerase sigma-70 factor (ECF subfamily)